MSLGSGTIHPGPLRAALESLNEYHLLGLVSNSVKMGTYCSVALWKKTVHDQIQMVEHSRWLSRVLMYRKLIMFRQCITGSVWPWWLFLQKHPNMYHSCKIMFRLMTGEHGLGSTIGLWHGKGHSKICTMCDLHMVETVQHILIECPSGRDSVCKLWGGGDIITVAPQCLTNEMMGMTPNTLVAFWFSGFKCNYVHEWDNYIVLYVSMYAIRIRREWKKNRRMKIRIFFCLYHYCNIMLCVVFIL